MNEEQLKKELEEAKQLIKLLKEEVGFAERGYTQKTKREWVGLTDADIAQTMHGSVEGSNMLPYQFARAIEAKLKENMRYLEDEATMMENQTEVMRITRDGVWVNPDMAVDETAKAVLDALDSQVKVMVQKAVEDERESCAKLVEADGLARGSEGLVLIKTAGRIRARSES